MITNSEKRQILKLRAKGYSVEQIAKAFGLHHTTILYHLSHPTKSIIKEKKRIGLPTAYHPYEKISGDPIHSVSFKKKFGKLVLLESKKEVDRIKRVEKIFGGGPGKNYKDMLKDYNKKVFIRDGIGNLIKVKKRNKIDALWIAKHDSEKV